MSLLFTPIQIGAMTLPNRLVMPAMHMNYTPDGEVNETLIAFYRERAKGGVGLILIGGCPVEAEAGSAFMIGVNHDRFIPGLTRFAAAMHEEGAKVGVQLYHAGRYTYSFFLDGQAAPSASATFSPLTKEMSREMTLDDIARCLDDFRLAARRAMSAGFDTVEVIASAGYLISQFLSPLTNTRTDAYGGSFENRARFGVEVLRAVKAEVGPKVPVCVRLAGNDFVPGSNGNDENAAFAKLLEEAGAAFFNVTGGWHESNIPQITNSLPAAGYSHLAYGVKRRVGVPVAASNRILDPAEAQDLLLLGVCDMISLGRALIADPYWPSKARDGREDEIVRCVSCNQECLDRVFELKPVGCLVNPQAGHESEPVPALTPAKRLVVVGGGPAGLTAARLGAARGHHVTLFEERDFVGGQLWAASAAPGKSEFGSLPQTLETQAELAGVEIRLGAAPCAAELLAMNADLLILATGARCAVLPIPGLAGDPRVIDAVDLLEGTVLPGARVVVLGGGPVGVEAALYTARLGAITAETAAFLLEHEAEEPARIRRLLLKGTKDVTMVEMTDKIGRGIGRSTRWVHLKELKMSEVTILSKTRALALLPEGLQIENEAGRTVLPLDSLVLAAGMKSHDPYAGLVAPPHTTVLRLGDAAKVGDAAAATRAAYELLREV